MDSSYTSTNETYRVGGRQVSAGQLNVIVAGLLLVLALPVACVSWTVTHEEIVREPREWLAQRSRTCPR